jgi:hypothetical protein
MVNHEKRIILRQNFRYAILLVWDEASMMHQYYFEIVDKSMHDIKIKIDPRDKYKLFGGMTMIFVGNFRQILYIIRKRQNMILLFLRLVLRLTMNISLGASYAHLMYPTMHICSCP